MIKCPYFGHVVRAARLQKKLMEGKVEGTRKTEEIMDRRGAGLMGMSQLECSRVAANILIWQRIPPDFSPERRQQANEVISQTELLE